MRAQAHVGERRHVLLPPMESHAHMERGQTTDKQQRTTNHIALPSRQVRSLISNDVFNIDAPANGAICLNSAYKCCDISLVCLLRLYNIKVSFLENWHLSYQSFMSWCSLGTSTIFTSGFICVGVVRRLAVQIFLDIWYESFRLFLSQPSVADWQSLW